MNYTVTQSGTGEYRTKGSRFLGFLHPVTNREEAEIVLTELRSEHHSATHHCYGWICNPSRPDEFSSDDGEPSGTAGLPLLNSLRSHQLMNVILTVIRYYGGTKLGKSGLIDAYSQSAQNTILNAELKKLIPVQTYHITYKYQDQSHIDALKHNFGWTETDATYTEHVSLKVAIPAKQSNQFDEAIKKINHLLLHFKKGDKSYTVF